MIDAVSVMGEVAAILGGLLGFLGVYGSALALLTLLLAGFVQMLLPFEKRTSFLVTVAIVTALALWQSYNAGRVEENLVRLVPYWIVMVTPTLIAMAFARLRRRHTGATLADQRPAPPHW
jgi:cell shape-determining protein MreD